jgi:hypothetical protein
MKKLSIGIIGLWFLVLPVFSAFSQEKAWDQVQPRKPSSTIVHGLIATGEIVLTNSPDFVTFF